MAGAAGWRRAAQTQGRHGRPSLFLNPREWLRMGENCKPACRRIRRQAQRVLDLSISDKRAYASPFIVPGGMVSVAQSASPQSRRLKMPRRPAQSDPSVPRSRRAPARRVRITGTPCRSC